MTDIQRLHERIDALDDKWDARWSELSGSVHETHARMLTEVALCASCRRTVMGNGGPSIDKRVSTLETIRLMSSKWFTVAVVAAASLLTGLVVSVASHLMG